MDGGPADIHDLQQELLEKIFKKLDEPDLVRVKNVCRRWLEIVDKRVGRKVYAGNSSKRLRWTDSTKVGIDQLSQIGIQSCLIFKRPELIREEEIEEELDSETEDEDEENVEGGNSEAESEDESEDEENEEDSEDSDDDDLESPDENQDDWESPLLGELKYPYLLRELELHGSLPPGLFAKLVKQARNLSVLKITLFTLAKLRNDDLESLALPNLKTLNVYMLGFEGEDRYFDSYEDDFLPNLKTLLTERHFPRLTSLKIDLPPPSFSDLSTIRILLTFVQKNCAIQKLSLWMVMFTNTDTVKNAIPEPDPATQRELRTIINEIRERGDRHLRDLVIKTSTEEPHPIRGFPFPGPMEIIKEFLLNVRSLERLIMDLGPIPSSTLEKICTRNSSTLRTLSINSEHSIVDCSMFAKLQDVQYLAVTSIHGIVGITLLPHSLTEIEVSGPIEQADANHILFHLPNLREILLYGGYRLIGAPCITLDMLRRLIENRKVELLYITGDYLLNTESYPPEGILNNDPNNPIMLQFDDGLTWILNEDRFYVSRYSR